MTPAELRALACRIVVEQPGPFAVCSCAMWREAGDITAALSDYADLCDALASGSVEVRMTDGDPYVLSFAEDAAALLKWWRERKVGR
jgi:hypothetical protein